MTVKTHHPGIELNELLQEEGLSQRELSSIIQIAPSHLNNIFNGNRNINTDIAIRLEAAGLKNAAYWLEKQMYFDLELSKEDDKISENAVNINTWREIQKHIPVSYFKKQGIIGTDLPNNIKAIFEVYNVKDKKSFIDKVEDYKFIHFRKSAAFSETRHNVIAWSLFAENKVKDLKVEKFIIEKREELIIKLRDLFNKNKNTIEGAKKLLRSYGIKFDTLDRPSKTPVDGKSFMSGKNPAIVLSLKYKRLDNFAFTLMHELGHVFLHLTKKGGHSQESFFTNNSQNDQLEAEANIFARNSLIPQKDWNNFILESPNFRDEFILKFSKKVNIHPAIVRGRVCYEYNNYYRRASDITTINKIHPVE